jgi:two-component system OmpR family sensor kinase
MGGLVEDLLLLAELDRGRPVRTDPVELHRICADVVDDTNASDHAHELTMALGRQVVVLGDAERLTQVAHNLVRNALTHTPAGSRVTVSAHAERGMGVIRVSDNGPGIDPALAPRVFDRFSRGDPGRTGPGSGLGLAIVRAIAEALGGSAEATRSATGGASVIVRIPLAPATVRRAVAAAPAEPLSASAPSLRGPGTQGPKSA